MNTNPTLITIEGKATYERILALVSDQDSEEAILQIRNFLLVYPNFAEAHNDLAVHYYQSGNNLKALAHYEKAHKIDPSNITYRKNLADFYFVELEWPDDAINTYLDILKDNPNDSETLNALGMISIRTGRREKARQYFTRSLQLDEADSQARQALQQLGELLPAPSQAVQISHQLHQPQPSPVTQIMQTPAVSQPPKQSPEQLYRQALELVNTGNSHSALRLLEKLILLHPSFAIAHNDLGVLCQQAGDIEKARRHHEEALRLQPDNATFLKNLADLLYIACGETEAAMNLYVRLLGSNPRDAEALKAVGQICLDNGKPDDARTFFESILKIEPWNGDAREALKSISEAVQKKQAAPAASRSADEIYAEALRMAQEERLNEAHVLLEELVRYHPDHALGHNDLGVVRYRLGDIEGTRRAYERAVELQPGNATFRKNLADLYFAQLGRTDDAIRIYLDLLRLQPRDLETLAGLGQICTAVGRPEEAKSFYRRALEIEPWNSAIRSALQGLI